MDIKSLFWFLYYNVSRLKHVNLEGNRLTDAPIINLCKVIATNNGINILNISNNFLTDKSCKSISNMLNFCDTLRELYLR